MEIPLHLKDELYNFDFNTYQAEYDWVKDMFKTEQDSIFHSEGNVGIHTGMVMNAVKNLPEFPNLSCLEKQVLFLSALFHDVEKRSTTKEEDGRIISPGHAKKGEITTRSILYRDFECGFSKREHICKLVRHHGLPLWIFEKQQPIKSIIESSLISNNYLLYLISKADIIGRECLDKDELLYKIELFHEYAKELNVLHTPKLFENKHSKKFFFEKDESFVDYAAYDDTICEVILMSGLPGSGKDYFVKHHLNLPVISLDDLRRKYKIKSEDKYGTGFIIQVAKEKAREFLRKKQSFIWNATNITKQIREQLIGLFRSYNASVKIVYLEVDYQKLLEQNINREYPIPNDVLEKFINKLEIPNTTEAHDVEYYNNYIKI